MAYGYQFQAAVVLEGLDHGAVMPDVPPPDTLPDLREQLEARLPKHLLELGGELGAHAIEFVGFRCAYDN